MRFILGLILLSLFACGKPCYWTHDTIRSHHKDYSKIVYNPRDPIHGIELELVSAEEHLKGYLNIHACPLPLHPDQSKSIVVKIEIDGQTTTYEAFRLEGGQRVLLPDDLLNTLVNSLSNDINVTVILPGYRSQILAEGFMEHFKHVQHPFFMENPFHLPF